MTPEEKQFMEHQLRLIHAEAIREDKRKREAIRYELSFQDRTRVIVAEPAASHT